MARRTFRSALVVLLSLALIAMLTRPALAAGGHLDPSFGGDGKVRTNFTPEVDYASGVAIQADGKIVAAGAADRHFNRSGKFALARYNADGTLDVTFGRDGRVTAKFTPRDDYAYEVAIQPDGKIVAAGQVGGRFALARYLGE